MSALPPVAVDAPRSRIATRALAALALALLALAPLALVTACAPAAEAPVAEPVVEEGAGDTAESTGADAGGEGATEGVAEGAAEEAAAPAGPVPAPPWETGTLADHPLVGQLWSVAEGATVAPEAMVADLATARFVMLGEKHDNPDHHRLQAWILRALLEAGRRPAVAFEQMTTDQEEALYDHLATDPRDAAGIAGALAWEESGWPEWAMYQPLAEAALGADLPLVPANVPRPVIQAVSGMGEPIDAATRERLGLDAPLPEVAQAALEAEIVEAHCGYLPEAMAPAMADAQRARDGGMADRIVRAALELPVDGAVLVTGNGHARADRGVPWHVERVAPSSGVASVALLEVVRGRDDALAYAEDFDGALPFDYVWFTPRLDDIDPCVKFEEELAGMGLLGDGADEGEGEEAGAEPGGGDGEEGGAGEDAGDSGDEDGEAAGNETGGGEDGG